MRGLWVFRRMLSSTETILWHLIYWHSRNNVGCLVLTIYIYMCVSYIFVEGWSLDFRSLEICWHSLTYPHDQTCGKQSFGLEKTLVLSSCVLWKFVGDHVHDAAPGPFSLVIIHCPATVANTWHYHPRSRHHHHSSSSSSPASPLIPSP